jgi:AAA+ ATPase superfamily predicted ATPase
MIVGRTEETTQLRKFLDSGAPEFVALYGRRRVGKTFLINEFFHNEFAFQVTGIERGDKAVQLENFTNALRRYGSQLEARPSSWLEAFEALISLLETPPSDLRKVVFIDEMPWLDTDASGFLAALEHFWNGWGLRRSDLMLIVCGSATSWIMNALINSHGGLYNRVTRVIALQPFTLKECEDYYRAGNIAFNRRTIVESYLIFGGIPHYMSMIEGGTSLAQNIDRICFSRNALLRNEFARLYGSLFTAPEKAIEVVKALASRRRGLSRGEIIAATGLSDGGSLTKLLEDLDNCGFIRRYVGFGKKERGSLYQLFDQFSLFYLDFMGDRGTDEEFWSKTADSGRRHAWSGYAFEQVWLAHVTQVKKALEIGGVLTHTSAWQSRTSGQAAQIDLIIDRNDQVINICEAKFTNKPFVIDKTYAARLQDKLWAFAQETKTRKALHLVLLTTYGLQQNAHSGIVQKTLTLDDLFAAS